MNPVSSYENLLESNTGVVCRMLKMHLYRYTRKTRLSVLTWIPSLIIRIHSHKFPQVHFRGLPRFTHVATLRGQLPRSLGISPHHGFATSPRRFFCTPRCGWDAMVMIAQGVNKITYYDIICNYVYITQLVIPWYSVCIYVCVDSTHFRRYV